LFVAISVARERVARAHAQIVVQIRASNALTALLIPLILSLAALLPGADVGTPAVIVSVAALLFVAPTLRRFCSVPRVDRENWRGLIQRISSTAVTGVILGFGIAIHLRALHRNGGPRRAHRLDWDRRQCV
jgi:hypothetical protein